MPVSATVPATAVADWAAIWLQEASLTPKEATAKCVGGAPLPTVNTVYVARPDGTPNTPLPRSTSERKMTSERELFGSWLAASLVHAAPASLMTMAATGAVPDAKLTVAGDEM